METGMTEADRFIIDQLTEGVLLLDSRLHILHCNPSLLSLLEGSIEDLYGKPLSVIAASSGDAILLSKSPSHGILKAEVRSFTGRIIHGEFCFSPLIGKNEILEGFAAMVRDSGSGTDLVRNLEALAEKYRDMALAGSDWFWEVDSTGTYTCVCPEVEAFLGYTPEELFGTSAFDLMPPGEGERVASIFNRIASRGVPFRNLQNTVLTSSGERRTVASSGVPLHDSRGGLRGYRGIDREISSERDMPWEDDLELETLGRILANLPFPAAVIENTGRVRKVSKALCELTGRTPAQLVGKMYETVLSGGPRDDAGQSWNSARWEDSVHSSGGTVPAVISRVPLDSCGGKYCLEILSPSPGTPPVEETPAYKLPIEVTEIHEGFLASLASALGGIAGFADLLEQAEHEEEPRRELIEMLRHYSSAVYRTIGSMRNYLEYSTGEFTIDEEFFVMSNLTQQVLNTFRLRPESKKILFKVQVDRSLQGIWRGPFRGMKVIMSSLLDGVIPSCGVLLGVSEVDSSASSSIIRFSLTISPAVSMSAVSDSGLNPEFMEALPRCRGYSETLGGEMLTGAGISGGFRVWADIPFTRHDELPRFKGRMNAMIISGNPHMTVLYSRMLESLGCEVPPSSSSSQVSSAVSLLRDCSDASFLFFDADSVMKGGNPLGSLDDIPGCGGMNVHKVLLASRVKPGDIQRSLAQGFSALLLKPVRLRSLEACLHLAASVGKGGKALITDNSFAGEN